MTNEPDNKITKYYKAEHKIASASVSQSITAAQIQKKNTQKGYPQKGKSKDDN